MIYLDHNATTPIAPEVRAAMERWLGEEHGNPSSGHAYGRRAKDALEAARSQVAGTIGARPPEIVFVGSGTEANHLAILGVADARGVGCAVSSAIEHPAVVSPLARLGARGWTIHRLPIHRDGRVDPRALDDGGPLDLVSVMLANNETGAIQPVAELARAAKARGAVVHTDAAQAVGKIPVDVDALGVDLLTVVGHKLYAPKGVGALYVREGTELIAQLAGGGQERGLRAGTENVAFAVALGAACELAARVLAAEARRQRGLVDRLFERLSSEVTGAARNVPSDLCLPNTLSVRLPGVDGASLLAHAEGVAASTGSACHDGDERPSSVLLAMGLSPAEARSTLRLSVGRGTTERDVDAAVLALSAAWRRAR
ncbi:MAG: cysteine desulfurase family protein [Sandaracinaceae bacterium]